MRLLVAGSLAGPLGQAARLAIAHGATLIHATDTNAALGVLRNDGGIGLVFCALDADLPGLVSALAAERILVPLVACGVDITPEQGAAAIRAGAREVLPLPPDPALIAAMLDAVERERPTMIAQDPAMRAVVAEAERIAATEAFVLLTGPSGTGKEVLARHIHRRSRRAGRAFIGINCAAIPEHLLESELFGHERGAFSGAVARRIGRIEAADGGTLLLDEIGEMDLRLQAKLLRVLQEREVDRLGGTAPVRVNMRVIATTNRDLSHEIRAGRFREDLFYRLNVIGLRLPPLAERPADIAALAAHFADVYAEVNGIAPRPLSAAALERLARYRWPGNVRELENAMHRAVLVAEGATIGVEAFALGVAEARPDESGSGYGRDGAADPVAGLVGRSWEQVERDLILSTLAHTLGNRTHAAAILGISIRALRNKLRDYAATGARVPPPGLGAAA